MVGLTYPHVPRPTTGPRGYSVGSTLRRIRLFYLGAPVPRVDLCHARLGNGTLRRLWCPGRRGRGAGELERGNTTAGLRLGASSTIDFYLLALLCRSALVWRVPAYRMLAQLLVPLIDRVGPVGFPRRWWWFRRPGPRVRTPWSWSLGVFRWLRLLMSCLDSWRWRLARRCTCGCISLSLACLVVRSLWCSRWRRKVGEGVDLIDSLRDVAGRNCIDIPAGVSAAELYLSVQLRYLAKSFLLSLQEFDLDLPSEGLWRSYSFSPCSVVEFCNTHGNVVYVGIDLVALHLVRVEVR